MATEYFNAGNTAMQEGVSWEETHRFRLLTKRFRYTLELFRDAYPSSFDSRMEKLREIQTLLGLANDAIVTAEMMDELGVGGGVREKARVRAEKKLAAARRYWHGNFESGTELQRWCAYLKRYADSER